MRPPHASSVSYGRAMPYWRNILEVAREERLAALRGRLAPGDNTAVHAMADRRSARPEFPAPSTDGLEVTEITLLDISLPAEPP